MAVKRRRQTRYFRNSNVSLAYVASYAARLLQQIKQQLSGVVSFTREDLLRLPVTEFEQVATITRYRSTCMAVSYLIEHGELVQMKFPDLCLAGRTRRYHFDEVPAATEYDATIRRLIATMPADVPFAVMHVVSKWRTDPQLTADTKRKAIRLAMPRLVREGLCNKIDDFEYQMGDGT